MAYTDYRIIRANDPMGLEHLVTKAMEEGWQPHGTMFSELGGTFTYQAMVKGTSESGGPSVAVEWSAIEGKPEVIAAGATEQEAREAIGAGTSNLALGSTATTAKPGNYAPTWAEVADKPAVIAAGATEAEARATIGAGTSSLELGSTATTAAPGDHNHAVVAHAASGLSASSSIQALAQSLSARIKALEDAAATP